MHFRKISPGVEGLPVLHRELHDGPGGLAEHRGVVVQRAEDLRNQFLKLYFEDCTVLLDFRIWYLEGVLVFGEGDEPVTPVLILCPSSALLLLPLGLLRGGGGARAQDHLGLGYPGDRHRLLQISHNFFFPFHLNHFLLCRPLAVRRRQLLQVLVCKLRGEVAHAQPGNENNVGNLNKSRVFSFFLSLTCTG